MGPPPLGPAPRARPRQLWRAEPPLPVRRPRSPAGIQPIREAGLRPAVQSWEGRRLTGSPLAPGIWSRRRGVSGGGRAGKPRCWRGQGLRLPAVRGRARGLGRRPAGRVQPAGQAQRRSRAGAPVSRGDREGCGLSTGADDHGPRPFTATRDTGPPFRGGRDRSPLPEPRSLPQRSAGSAQRPPELRGLLEGLRPPG